MNSRLLFGLPPVAPDPNDLDWIEEARRTTSHMFVNDSTNRCEECDGLRQDPQHRI